MPLLALTDCASDSVATGEIIAHWAALTGEVAAVLPLPIALQPAEQIATTSFASHALYRQLFAASEHLGTPAHPLGMAINAAARDGQYVNGVPFCSFRFGAHVVTAPYNGQVLRMVRRYLGVTHVEVVEIQTVLEAAQRWGDKLSDHSLPFIVNQKFRSLWFQLRYTHWLLEGRPVPSRQMAVPVPDDDELLRASFIDGFRNVFFNITADELGLSAGNQVYLPRYSRDGRLIEWVDVVCRADFADVALGEPALLVGYGFPMLVIGCDPAAEFFGFRQGQPIELRRTPVLTRA